MRFSPVSQCRAPRRIRQAICRWFRRAWRAAAAAWLDDASGIPRPAPDAPRIPVWSDVFATPPPRPPAARADERRHLRLPPPSLRPARPLRSPSPARRRNPASPYRSTAPASRQSPAILAVGSLLTVLAPDRRLRPRKDQRYPASTNNTSRRPSAAEGMTALWRRRRRTTPAGSPNRRSAFPTRAESFRRETPPASPTTNRPADEGGL